MSSINKSKQNRSREKTPRWLTDPNQSKNTTDSEFEKDREAFLKQIKINWEK